MSDDKNNKNSRSTRQIYEEKRRQRRQDLKQNQLADDKKNKSVKKSLQKNQVKETPSKQERKRYKGIVPTIKSFFSGGGKSPLAFIAIIAVLVLLAFVFRKNSAAVFLDDKQIDIVSKKVFSKDKDGKVLEEELVRIIESKKKIKIKSEQKLKIEFRRNLKSKINTKEHLLAELEKNVKYSVKAVSITVVGDEIAVVKSMDVYEKIINEIKNQYDSEESENKADKIEKDFVEEVKGTDIWVNESELLSEEDAKKALSATTKEQKTYTVVSGDTLSLIADKVGMSQDALKASNPSLAEPLRVGDEIVTFVEKPIVTVKTVETRVFIETIGIPETEYVEDKSISPGKSVIRQKGVEGEMEVTEIIVKLNGVEDVDSKTREEKILKEAKKEIIANG